MLHFMKCNAEGIGFQQSMLQHGWQLTGHASVRFDLGCTGCRDVAPRLNYQKPALIESRFFPALQACLSHITDAES